MAYTVSENPSSARTAFLPSVRRFLAKRLRLLPDFLIIGTQRGGTTSLYNYLSKHPNIAPAAYKEAHFFDYNYHKGVLWYRRLFPNIRHKWAANLYGERFITGEATPMYLFHPFAVERVGLTLPDVKLIALLRNPIDRAYSQYQHELKRGHETLSFADAITAEPERLRGEVDKMRHDPTYNSAPYEHFSYLARGVYIEQLERWWRHFPKERLLLIESETFYREPRTAMQQVYNFLNLSFHELAQYEQYNAYEYSALDADLRQKLSAFFRPHNERLFSLTGIGQDWA